MIALRRLAPAVCAMLLVLGLPAVAQTTQPQKGPKAPRNITCTGGRLIHARVAALDAPFFVNRLGATMAEGMTFALERDIVRLNDACPAGWCARARLREGKRPRPIVLRANEGDCLHIEFTNLLSGAPTPLATTKLVSGAVVLTQPATRYASIHIAGVQVFDIQDDGTFVASNPNSIAAPGETRHYYVRATQQGTFMLNSQGASWGGQNVPNDGAQVTAGLFGALNVEPRDAIWLRSQVTHDEMLRARDKTKGNDGFTTNGQPLLDFNSPLLRMLQQNTDGSWELMYTDLTAVIAGPPPSFLFPVSTDPNTSPVPYEPERRRPFREFTIEYHELSDAVQAFPIYGNGKKVAITLGAAGDAFAINYGAGGIGSEILANRFGLGPMNSCADCRFEEFFLSSWTVGDPAMVVDFPANSPCFDQSLNHAEVTSAAMNSVPCTPGVAGNAPEGIVPQRKATVARYPDDPSNIYRSYINDRVIFRTLHAGTGVSHVHHLHAHQWFHSPNSDGSTYLDSQLINPGSAYTMEIAHLGSGNLNKVVGDSIFHCHFYPHFAAGMWAHWRSHDTFEIGTQLDGDGRPTTGGWNRAQPDGEIVAGTPIPALVPMPGLAMAPMPARVRVVAYPDPNNPSGPPVGYRAEVHPDDLKAGINPGFPFFIPGIAGTRAPHPPLDFAKDEKTGKELNGGLPRHILVNARITEEEHTYLNFSKDMDNVNAFRLPEEGTVEEQVAMAYHEKCTHNTFTSLGAPGKFRTNGRPRISGAPYANPGVVSDSDGDACDPPKRETQYKAAVIQTDLVINKLGWHYPQSRFLTLWEDVLPTFDGKRTPQPFFIRTNADTAVTYWHTNLVPDYYLLDDYQVRTPTDIIGQHIHLVKFDVTSSDGAANGYNYEDGTLSYQDVQARIEGINECGGLAAGLSSITPCDPKKPNKANRITLTAEPPPAGICPDPNEVHCKTWLGAQTTVQRWFAESLSTDADKVNGERTIRTVFTHDHFGPSTHQQVGLYAAVLIEPSESKWYLNDGAKTPMHTRPDGGPTSWEAIIETPGATPKGKPNAEPVVDPKNTYREFAIALQDFQFAYQPNSINQPKEYNGSDTDANGTPVAVHGGLSWVDTANAIEPANGVDPTAANAQASPQIVSAGPTAGTLSFNYRQEPLPFRVQGAGSPGDPRSTDLSYVFSSQVPRNNTKMGAQPVGGSPICTANCPPPPTPPYTIFKFPPPLTPGVQPGDPYTPLLRAYEGDNIQIRVVVGAHMLPHAFTMHGLKWLFEPSFADSGYRSTQSMGISEHFEFLFTMPRASPSTNAQYPWADYLYTPDASNQKHGIVDGMWGLFRAYQKPQSHLATLSNNTNIAPVPARADGYSCPPSAPVRSFLVNAESPSGQMVYNNRGVGASGIFPSTQIVNPNPLLYSFQSTTAPGGQATNVTPNRTEPLILRANAGDCISLTLKNNFALSRPVFSPSGGSVAVFAPNIPLLTSQNAGITPALLSYDVMNSAGMNVGWNPEQTAAVAGTRTYRWYAGQTSVDAQGNITGTPIEFGGVNLTPSDPLQQDLYGLVGGMIIEPPGSVPCYDTFNPQAGYPTYASATIYSSGTCAQPGKLHHREFVLVTQDDVTPKLGWPAGACYCAVPGANFNPNTCSPCLTPAQTTTETFVIPLNTSVNYRTEPMAYRMNIVPQSLNRSPDLWRGFSDSTVLGEPQTPIFSVARNTPTRLHLLHPGGAGDQQVLSLHGHVWQELPYARTSTAIGDNRLSMWLGARDNYGTNTNYSIVLDGNGGAGGREGAIGDYQYRTHPGNFISQGLWGIMRVGQGGSDIVKLVMAQLSSGGLQFAGSASPFVENSSNPKNGQRASTLSLFIRPIGSSGNGTAIGSVDVNENGLFTTTMRIPSVPNLNTSELLAVSPLGGRATVPIQFVELPATVPALAPGTSPVGESIRFNNTARPTPADPTAQQVPTTPMPVLQGPPPAPENPPQQPPSEQ